MKIITHKFLFLALICSLFLTISPFAAKAAIDNMVGYWDFDGGDVAGKIEQAQSFSTNGSGFDTGENFDLTNFTLSVWVKTQDSDRGDLILSFNDGSVNFSGFGLVLNPGLGCNAIGLWVGDMTDFYICSSLNVNDDDWHLVTATFDGTTGLIFIDGNEDASNTRTANLTHSTNAIFGFNPYDSSHYEGLLDDVRIYDRALSSEEVAELHDFPPGFIVSTSTISVIASVINDNGGTATPSDFMITVTAENPSVLSFQGSLDPVEVIFDAGAYVITASASSSYVLTASDECKGDLLAGKRAICTISYDDVAVTVPPVGEIATTTPAEPDPSSERRSSSGSTRKTAPAQQTVTNVQEKILCTTIDESLRFGSVGEEVKKLQELLNDFIGSKLVVTSIFDNGTKEAVEAFQLKYAEEILAPWGISEPSGIVSFMTQKKLNELSCKMEFPLSAIQLAIIENYKNPPVTTPVQPAIEVGVETISPLPEETQSANVLDASDSIVDKVSSFLKNIF